MTFTYTDTDSSGDHLTAEPATGVDGLPVVALIAEQHRDTACVHIPLDRVEELVAGLRDVVRQAGGQQPTGDALTAAERRFLTFALDLAFDRMVSDDGFTDEAQAALKKLRRLAAMTLPVA